MSNVPEPHSEPLEDTNIRDVSLMEQVKSGDTDAFQTLVELHQHRVIGTISKMLGNDAEAEDLAQQVFVRVWRSAPRYQPDAKFTTWLFTIVRNLVSNEMRRRKRHPLQSLDPGPDGDGSAMQVADHTVKSPSTSIVDKEVQDAIQAAIDALPEAQRMAIILRRYDEFSYEEIAEILKLSVPAVKSLIFRARAELRDRLRDYLES